MGKKLGRGYERVLHKVFHQFEKILSKDLYRCIVCINDCVFYNTVFMYIA